MNDRSRRYMYPGLVLSVLNVHAAFAQTIPAPDPEVGRIVAEISRDNIRRTVDRLVGFGTRHTLSDTTSDTRGIGAARRWIESEFRRIAAGSGGRMSVARFDADIPASRRLKRAARVVDIVATFKGRDPDRVFVLGAHYDSRNSDVMDETCDAPGANDDGSGIAVVLECARVLSAVDLNATVVFIAFAGEEEGLLGSTAWVEMAKERHLRLDGMLNNDIVGSSRDGVGNTESSFVRLFSQAFSPQDTGAVFRRRNALGLENDGPSRNLARAALDIAGRYVPAFGVKLVYRLDRFLRGGDHEPFHDRGYAAVRFCAAKENYDWQHQDVRTEAGKKFGDLLENVDFDYCTNVARVNAAVLADLALAPESPPDVRIVAAGLGYGTQLQWGRGRGAFPRGYVVKYRETDAPVWQGGYFTADTTIILKESKDDYLFGVEAVGSSGAVSLPAIPTPFR